MYIFNFVYEIPKIYSFVPLINVHGIFFYCWGYMRHGVCWITTADALRLSEWIRLLLSYSLPRLDDRFAHIVLCFRDSEAGGYIVQHHLIVLVGLGLRAHQHVLGYLGEMLLDVGEEDGVFFVGLDVAELGGQVVDEDAVGAVFDFHAIAVSWGTRGALALLQRYGRC
jgi:hypothetical protein